MATPQEQATQKETKLTEKCTCTKRIVTLEKQVNELKAEIALLRLVLRSAK